MTPGPVPANGAEMLRTTLAAECEARIAAEATVTHLKLVIARLRHDKFGASSERGCKPLDQLELELGASAATVAEDAARSDARPCRRRLVQRHGQDGVAQEVLAENRGASHLEQQRMVEAIASGDAEAARQAGEAHALSGKARWLRTLAG